MTKICKREWVIRESAAFGSLLQRGYLVVPGTATTVRGVRWIQMQIMLDGEADTSPKHPADGLGEIFTSDEFNQSIRQ
jgi:hypothetical protein